MPRFILLVAMCFSLLTSACAAGDFAATPISLNERIAPGGAHQGIRFLGALRLSSAEIGGLRLCGLSGLAWDEDAGLLYAVSDQGDLFHFRPIFDQQGYLSGAQAIAAYPLQDSSGQPVSAPFDDAEGLAIRNGENGQPGDAVLLVSFEGKPRVVRYSPAGRWQGEERLPALLRNIRNYRHPNQALEALALDPQRGIVVGSETPLRGDPDQQIRLFARNGQFWNYPLSSAPNSALVAMEALPDGGLLTLERAFVAPLRPLIISLRRTQLPASKAAGALLKVTDVAVFDSSQGWLLDNFEGLTRHRDQRFFMISDDNCSALQTTLLVYFELLPTPLDSR